MKQKVLSIGIAMLLLFSAATVCLTSTPDNCGQKGYAPGDVNMDCSVNMMDMAIIAINWLNCSTPAAVECDDFSMIEADVVAKPDTSMRNDFYVSNRAPLKPNALVKLPVGAVEPDGWLLEILNRQKNGMNGHMDEISAWLQEDDNAWLSDDGHGEWGWEELPYWLKGYANLGYILKDYKIINNATKWIEGTLNCQHANGDFGPLYNVDGGRDYWANMVMLFCLQSYYEYSKDERVIELMTDYFQYQLSVPDSQMLTGYWQHLRGGDNLYSIYWLYNHTGDTWLLDLAEKMHRNTSNWKMDNTLPNWHNVNIAQGFREPATYYMQSHDLSDLQATYDDFNIIRDLYGQVPGGMFGSDENCRPGYDDPHQAIETCGLVEQMLSDEMLTLITGDTFWADHCEEVAFNMLPAALTPDMKALRYFTAPNMISSDRHNHSPGIQNAGPFLMMNPLSHRCCQHNHSHGWPYFVENLWTATPDNGLCAAMYAASKVTAKVGNGTEVSIKEDTKYPFEQQIQFTISTVNPVEFPLYMRIPNWCDQADVRVNGKSVALITEAGKYIKLKRIWREGDVVLLTLPMEVKTRKWVKNHNSVSVDYGPLTFSLKIDENYVEYPSPDTVLGDSKWQSDLDTSKWPSYEILPESAWNYGLVLDETDPAASFTIVNKPWPADNYPFTPETAPIGITVKAKKIPEWVVDENGLCGILQDSPAFSNEPTETIDLVPLGSARLRISAFPTVGDGPDATRWLTPLLYNPTASQCWGSDTVVAMCDQKIPSSSDDHSIPRMTFWDHKGTSEWVQYTFEEAMEVTKVGVYWFDDTGIGECRVPSSWKLQYLKNGTWTDVQALNSYGTSPDKFNEVNFNKVTTTSLRITVQLKSNYSSGILEWQVN